MFWGIKATAADINPSLTTPAEQSRQGQLEAQERLHQQERERLLRQQQEIKPDGEGTSRMKMLIGDLNLSVPFSVSAPWGSQALQYTANLRGQANYTPLTPAAQRI